VSWPERPLELQMRVPEVQARAANDGYCLLYRPLTGAGICFEPVTHPIDAFHMPGQTGLVTLDTQQSLQLHVEWRLR
jgi:aldose 1-epimerase